MDVILLHTKGRLITGPFATANDNVISFAAGRGSTALVKITEPMSPMLNYFEIQILQKGIECAIGIGVGALNYPQGRMPGWNRNSIGYHADDGHLYHERGVGHEFGPLCTEGDVMGCGIDFSKASVNGNVSVFFTKNRKPVGSPQTVRRPLNGFYPLIGLHSDGEKICYLGHHLSLPIIPAEPMSIDDCPSSHWFRSNGIAFTGDCGLTIEYAGTEQDIAVVQSNTPLSSSQHYFELTIDSIGESPNEANDKGIILGLAGRYCHCIKQPGTYPHSTGYCVATGRVLSVDDQDKSNDVVKCEVGDVVGCGIIVNEEKDSIACSDDQFSDDESDIEPFSPDVISAAMAGAGDLEGFLGGVRGLGAGGLFGALGGGVLGGLRGGLFGGDEGELFERFVQPRILINPNKGNVSKVKKERSSPLVTVDVYFTRNGSIVHSTRCLVPSGRSGLYPTVALCFPGDRVTVNLDPLTG